MTMDQVASLVAFFFFLGGIIGWHLGHWKYAEMRKAYQDSIARRMVMSNEMRVAAAETAAFNYEFDTRIRKISDQLEASIEQEEKTDERN